MNTIKYNASTLAAVALAISTEETRYYLNGVMFDGQKAVATDGHLMTVAVDNTERTKDNPTDAPAIMPISKKAITAMKGKKAEFVEFKDGTLTVWDEFNNKLYMEPSEAIDGTFPNWEQVMPSTDDSQVSHGAFGADLLITVANSAKILGNGSGALAVQLRGEDATSPHYVKYGNLENVYSVLMPRRV